MKTAIDTLHVNCPKLNKKVTVNICAGCQHRGVIDFANHQVECFYPASVKPDILEPEPDPGPHPGDPDERTTTNRDIHLRAKKLYVLCPRFSLQEIDLNFCTQTCSLNQGYTFTHVICAYVKEKSP